MRDAAALARSAASLTGCRFRLHGRDPSTGLDCVGVVVASLRASDLPCQLPTGYQLRTGQWPDADSWATRNNFTAADGSCRPGDVLLMVSGPSQLHMAVVAMDPSWIVEAHAGLRKVVLSPLPDPATIFRRWRLGAKG